MTNDKYKMVQDLADGWREKYEDAKQQLAKAHRLIDELETKRDIAVSTLEKVKADRTVAQNALAEQCKHTKSIEQERDQLREHVEMLRIALFVIQDNRDDIGVIERAIEALEKTEPK